MSVSLVFTDMVHEIREMRKNDRVAIYHGTGEQRSEIAHRDGQFAKIEFKTPDFQLPILNFKDVMALLPG